MSHCDRSRRVVLVAVGIDNFVVCSAVLPKGLRLRRVSCISGSANSVWSRSY